jgi:hypothetical protein
MQERSHQLQCSRFDTQIRDVIIFDERVIAARGRPAHPGAGRAPMPHNLLQPDAIDDRAERDDAHARRSGRAGAGGMRLEPGMEVHTAGFEEAGPGPAALLQPTPGDIGEVGARVMMDGHSQVGVEARHSNEKPADPPGTEHRAESFSCRCLNVQAHLASGGTSTRFSGTSGLHSWHRCPEVSVVLLGQGPAEVEAHRLDRFHDCGRLRVVRLAAAEQAFHEAPEP